MALFESQSLYIDFSKLPAPSVIEVIDEEALLAIYQQQVLKRNPKMAAAIKLEQSSANVILQAEAYGEMMVRARINSAARALMLPFARGTDLDVLGAFQDVAREPGELDERFRRRIQLAPEAFNTAGSEGAYIWQALKADPTIRDASAIKSNGEGGVRVTIMSEGDDPVPTRSQFINVITRLNSKMIKPLTDDVSVGGVDVLRTVLRAGLSLYPGPDPEIVLNTIRTKLANRKARLSALGRSLTVANLMSDLNQEGVQNVDLRGPLADLLPTNQQCVVITDAELEVSSNRRF